MSNCDRLFQEIVRLQKAAGSGDIPVRTTDLGNQLTIPHLRVEGRLSEFAAHGRIRLWALLDKKITPFVEWQNPHEVFNSTDGGTVVLRVLEEIPASTKLGF